MAQARRIAEGAIIAVGLGCAPAFAQLAGGSPEVPPDRPYAPSGYTDYPHAIDCSSGLSAIAEILGPSHEMHDTFVAFAAAYRRWAQPLAEQAKIPARQIDRDIGKRRSRILADFKRAKSRGKSAEAIEDYRAGASVCILFGRDPPLR